MLRSQVIQSALDLFTSPTYLEIGVDQGLTFHDVRASSKVAVDPKFKFDFEKARADNPHCYYHEVTSDHFFQHLVARYPQFDVVFLDGLHTFEQTLRDLLNSIVNSHSRSVIIIDDVRPISYSSSLRNERDALLIKHLFAHEADGAWMGDVFKLVFFIEAFWRTYSYATVEENNSHQLLLWRQPREDVCEIDRTVEQISRLELKDVVGHRDSYRSKPLQEIVNSIKRAQFPQNLSHDVSEPS